VAAIKRVKHHALPAPDSKSSKSGNRKHRGIGNMVLSYLSEARIHIAAYLRELGFGKKHGELKAATGAAGGDEPRRIHSFT
jgi:hypothetical protein